MKKQLLNLYTYLLHYSNISNNNNNINRNVSGISNIDQISKFFIVNVDKLSNYTNNIVQQTYFLSEVIWQTVTHLFEFEILIFGTCKCQLRNVLHMRQKIRKITNGRFNFQARRFVSMYHLISTVFVFIFHYMILILIR